MTLNSDLTDRAIRRAILLEGFKRSEVAAIIRLLERQVFPDILRQIRSLSDQVGRGPVTMGAVRRRVRLERLLAGLNDTVRGGAVLLHGELVQRMTELARNDAAWQARAIRELSPIELDYVTPAPSLLRSAVVSRPMQGRFLRQWSAEVGTNATRRVSGAIRQGIVQGEGTDVIVRRVRGTVGNRFADGVLNATRHDAARVVRTAVTHVTTQARQVAFEQNSDLIAFVRWLSVLDSRTSQICAGLDGQTWPVDRGPRPPAHPNCRSDVVVGLRPVENIPGVDFTKLPPATRASMGGEVPAVQKLGEWLRGQPIATQESILGKAKAALFRRGVVPIKRFVDVPTLRPLKLRELERIEKQINAGKVARLSLR